MKRRVVLVSIVLIVVAAGVAIGQYAPPDGGEDLEDLFSALLLAESGSVVGSEGPQADTLNPAASGLVQRTTIDASYIALVGFDPATGWQGHAANIGLIAPTRAAVLTTSAHLLIMPIAGMQWGTAFTLYGAASKELYPGWVAGAGLRLIGGGLDQFDFGAALDLGMYRYGAAFSVLRNVEWGVAFRNIGKWYEPVSTDSALSTPFTPAVGMAFDAVDTDWLTLRAGATLTAPGFRNVRLGLNARAVLFNVVSLHGGWEIDARQLLDSGIASRSLIPSFGLSVTFRTALGEEGFAASRGWTQTEVTTTTSAAPLYNGVWGIGAGINAPLGVVDATGPVIEVTYPETEYVSPNNDGEQDALIVPIAITDERYVVQWQFEVLDSSGEVVRVIENKEDRPENAGFQSLVDRIVAVDSGVSVPEEVRWDGYSNAGTLAPDGNYTFLLRAFDDNGNTSTSQEYRVVVDATAPAVEIGEMTSTERIFSPNGDGNKDELTIQQSGSSEDSWSGAILNASGAVVRTFTWDNEEPPVVTWDGRGDDGIVVPDGVYRYQVAATDRAANDGSATLANIIVNTEATPVSLSISTGLFSPNRDGTQDTVTLTPDVPNTVGIESWSVVVRNAAGEAVRTFTGSDGPPVATVFDGLDDSRSAVAEGAYVAELHVVYRNGNRPTAESASFVIDVTAPVADARLDRELFSPDNDGNLDTITIFNEASREDRWVGRISNSAGTVVKTFTWLGVPDQSVTWSGRQDDGRLAPDGQYYYQLESVDGAGNRGSTTPIPLRIDTSGAVAAVRAEFEAFSPNADGVRDSQRLVPQVDLTREIAAFSLEVQSSAGETIRTFEGRDALAGVTWDGTRSNGRRAPDGEYRGVFSVRFANGAEAQAETAPFILDTVAPTISLSTDFLLFSPDGDGNRDTMVIRQSSSDEEQWTGAIAGRDGTVVQEFIWTGSAGDVTWAGTDAAGNAVPDGSYRYTVTTTDRAGNEARGSVDRIVVDTRQPRLFLTASTDGISPNGDGQRESVSFELYTSLLDGIDEWSLVVKAADGSVVREFSEGAVVGSRSIVWNGRDERGRVIEGVFTGEYTVRYEKGNEATVQSGEIRVDITPPDARVSLSPVPFSPDNDGVDDELAIRLQVQDESSIQGWRFEILDRNRRFFNEFTGRGMPSSQILWDGRASDGELVISAEDYPYVLTIGDDLGNVATVEGVIPVDILVIRVGDRLIVQIPNITFAPNSPELVLDPDDERGAKNLEILQRLAVIFEKYDSYNIRVEGHAVNVTGTVREEREELAPLSLARAEQVRDALISAGISPRRITAAGLGGTEPIVPHTDEENRWKNRRVEFVLIR